MGSLELELRGIKTTLNELRQQVDLLIKERETLLSMKASEPSLNFLKREPDLYTVRDLKVKYK